MATYRSQNGPARARSAPAEILQGTPAKAACSCARRSPRSRSRALSAAIRASCRARPGGRRSGDADQARQATTASAPPVHTRPTPAKFCERFGRYAREAACVGRSCAGRRERVPWRFGQAAGALRLEPTPGTPPIHAGGNRRTLRAARALRGGLLAEGVRAQPDEGVLSAASEITANQSTAWSWRIPWRVQGCSLETDGDDVSDVEEARRSPSAGACGAVFTGGGPARASSKVFLTPFQKVLVKSSFISFLACQS